MEGVIKSVKPSTFTLSAVKYKGVVKVEKTITELEAEAKAHTQLSFYGTNGRWACERQPELPKPTLSGLEVLEVI
jgi:hypothetical protein